jgi:hypothetical protein
MSQLVWPFLQKILMTTSFLENRSRGKNNIHEILGLLKPMSAAAILHSRSKLKVDKASNVFFQKKYEN